MYFRKIRLVVRSKELVLVISYRLSFVSLFIPGLKLQVSTRFLGLEQYKDILSFVCVINFHGAAYRYVTTAVLCCTCPGRG